eukprot:XP_014782604.1 PREDICTED: uncharacterized protein LOC106878033 [Octopus bimaculoides]
MDRLTITIISTYAPQAGLASNQKDRFYEVLLQTTSMTNDRGFIVVAGDFNGHVGQHSHGFHGVYGSYGIGTNANFRKAASHLISYQSGGNISQVNYILTRITNDIGN